MSDLPQRKSIRLPEYDYSQFGYYFITICTENREMYFENDDVKQMIENIWKKLPTKFNNVDLDEHVIMPNHLHGIIVINNSVGATLVVAQDVAQNKRAGTRPAPTIKSKSLGDIIGVFKSITTYEYIQNIKTNNWPWFAGRLWQRNYYERSE